ncbi:MAG: PPOX class probable F420-dependent enzyme [Candidatus Poriferisodalaceae bacterium]|jgi:PPOX class probable F420-dependent enzyme
MPEISNALEWAAERKHGVLITIRRDGRPQSSDIAFSVEDGAFLISLTADRAKTHNMRRDPRVVLHLTEPSSWSYLSFDGIAELSEVTTDPGDATSNQLVAYYEAVAGQAHPDWNEYRQAMIDEGRLLARLAPTSVVGQMR